jgi:hypothetical protein
MRTEKEELIIKLYKEGKTWDQISHVAKVSPNTTSRVVDGYEQSGAFKLFLRGLSPIQVRIKLSLSSDKVEKHYLVFRRLYELFELSSVCNELGQYVPDFLDFYKSARSLNITPEIMHSAINFAGNIEFLKQENYRERLTLTKNKSTSAQVAANLAEVRGQIIIAAEHLSRMKNELESLRLGTEKIKNTEDYRRLEDLIFDAVSSISSEKYFLWQVAVIAVMKAIQEDSNLIPYILFPSPNELDLTAQTSFHQSIPTMLINKSEKFMPVVLEELGTESYQNFRT